MATTKPTHFNRDYQLRYTDIAVLHFPSGPWKQAPEYAGTQTRFRVVGQVTTRVHTSTSSAVHTYTIVHVETRTDFGIEQSSYESRLHIGNLVDAEHAADLFDSRTHNRQGLWCADCWRDDIYGNGAGAVEIPKYFMGGRYYSKLEYLDRCICCGKHYTPFGDAPRDPEHLYLFSSIRNAELMAAVTDAFLPRGILVGRWSVTPEPRSEEFKEQLVAEAMAPARIGARLEAYGDAALAC